MSHRAAAALGAVVLFSNPVTFAQVAGPAQVPAATLPEVSPQYVVSYIEVAPSAAQATAQLARIYRDATRREAGVVRFDLYQRVHAPHHFALVGEWIDTKASQGHVEATHTRSFRGALSAHRSAPYDERCHHALNAVGPQKAESGVVAITHVDIIPTFREAGIESVKVLADQSRGTPGNLRYDALTQSNHPNHMTLVEVWRDEAADHDHLVSAHLRAFRDALLPRSGSLYDERLYKALD